MSAPTFPTIQELAEGSGTRAFTGIATAANDWFVVECIGEDGGLITALTPTCPTLTFLNQNNVGASNKTRIQQWTAQDTAGSGSRVVTITPNTGTNFWYAHITLVRGSAGVGTGKGTAGAAQVVSIARQGDNSAMFMSVGDWSAGAVGAPTWLPPEGITVASQQGTHATYVFGRLGDSDTPATELHGVSLVAPSPTYVTPSVAVLEMLGTTTAPETGVPAGVYRKVPIVRHFRG
jgi:hypothetical protein